MENGRPVQVHIPFHMLRSRMEEVAEFGINPEVFLDVDEVEGMPKEALRRIRDLFGRLGRRITMHGPYAGLNPGSMDERKRVYTEGVYMRALEAASHLGPEKMVLHACYDEKTYRGDADLWMYQSMKTWPAVVREAERLGVTVVAENIFEKRPDTLKRLVEEVGSKSFRVCIDSGHLNVFSEADTRQWFSTLGPFIKEVHVHDNFGSFDDHLPVGEGVIDFDEFFGCLREYTTDAVITIEAHGEEEVRRGLEAVKRYL